MTYPRPSRRRRIVVRGSWSVIGVLSVVVVYAAGSLFIIGWAWPLPVLLPQSFSFHGNTYHRDGGCRPLSVINRHPPHLHRVGSLTSAVWLGNRAIYSYTLPPYPHTYDFVLVQDDGCYQYYLGDKAG